MAKPGNYTYIVGPSVVTLTVGVVTVVVTVSMGHSISWRALEGLMSTPSELWPEGVSGSVTVL
jgi:hypothetical protein